MVTNLIGFGKFFLGILIDSLSRQVLCIIMVSGCLGKILYFNFFRRERKEGLSSSLVIPLPWCITNRRHNVDIKFMCDFFKYQTASLPLRVIEKYHVMAYHHNLYFFKVKGMISKYVPHSLSFRLIIVTFAHVIVYCYLTTCTHILKVRLSETV